MHLLKAFLTLLVLICLGINSICPPALAQASQSAKPKLVLLIVADHFSYNYLSRYQDKLSSGGLRYLMEHGANYTNCRLSYATSQNACGQAAISTGANPWLSGIVADEWYVPKKNKVVSATADDTYHLVGASGQGASSMRLVGTTIGDQMKLATNGRSKVVSCSLRDTSALMLAGVLANGAYWFDRTNGNFVTSSQYSVDLPAWAKAFNDQRYADKYNGKPWQRSLPETEYGASTRDDYPYEKAADGWSKTFPHTISGQGEAFYNAFSMTPWANQMTCDFAKEAIEKEFLGQHNEPDMLCLSLAAGDHLTQAFGPYSQEAEDLVLKMDQSLSSLFQVVDQKVGLNNTLIVFTAAHGTMPIPEFLKERRMNTGKIDPKTFRNLLDSALDSQIAPDEWIDEFSPPNVYLKLETLEKQKVRQADVEAVAAKLAKSIAGVGDVLCRHQLILNQVQSGGNAEAQRRSYYWNRSGELLIYPKPGYVFASETAGTGSGSPFAYDTQVPLILCGTSIRAGRYSQTVSPIDIAPTVTSILGIEAPSLCEGSGLVDAIGQVMGPPRPRTTAAQAAPAAPAAQ